MAFSLTVTSLIGAMTLSLLYANKGKGNNQKINIVTRKFLIGLLAFVFSFSFLAGCDKETFRQGTLDVHSSLTLSRNKKEFILSPGTYEVKVDTFSKKEWGIKNHYFQITLKNRGRSLKLDPIKAKLTSNESTISIHGENYTVISDLISEVTHGEEYSTTVGCTYSGYVYRCKKKDYSIGNGRGCQDDPSSFSDDNVELCKDNSLRDCETFKEYKTNLSGNQSALAQKIETHYTLNVDFISLSSNETVAELIGASYSSSDTVITKRTGACSN